MSYGVWNIDLSHGKIFPSQINHPDFPKQFKPYILKHCQFYEKSHQPKSIYYYAQMGEVVMSRIVNGVNIEVKMLPLQGLLLDDLISLYNNKIGVSESILINRIFWSEYEVDYRLNILKSFVVSGIVEKNNDKYKLSNSWNPENSKLDLIKIFYELSKYKQEVVVKLNSVLAFEREKTVSAVINHLLKRSDLSKEELYNKVKEKCVLFDVNDELFEKTIKMMKEKVYLIESDGMFIKAVF